MKIKVNNLMIALLTATLLVSIFNYYQLDQLGISGNVIQTGSASQVGRASSISGSSVAPAGVPEIYGKELGISFDDVSPNDRAKADATINVLAQIDRSVELSGSDKERYINTLYKLENGISCEYCCGARSIIFEDGRAACGCAHSFAMRGLAKYLITEHGNEYTDAEILEEVGKWKTLFFPTQMSAKAKILEDKGVEVNYIELASNKNRGIEKGSAGGGMVGGC